ncbi:small, acid-soluble spore protein, alpha/beta type [Paenibacillus tarimensis]|uniref:small, acid-soluble spore protein, alpha/beta type n=1 Tax=Paenibacillus tarimensis TaxID=416012 RepID=UPI001F162583|nr:alpha/beta-type small acid-soluble spore protein [Paenibacillus tarimensis]MCF2944318.1 alpha/beta-type small acid-soluble spore protein [Paenibacillus tarimensis]
MARRSRRKLLVDGSRSGVDQFKARVMQQQGFKVNPERPNEVKYEVARELGVPLQQGDNGHLTTEMAGHVGGRIGGSMVREMIRMAQEQLSRQP